jgi:anti-anti-sigma regulatory factor
MADIRTEDVSPTAIILLPQGYLDRPLGQSIKTKVQEALAAGKKRIAISFGQISMINSLGMSELIECFEIAEEGEIWFADVSGMVHPILEAAGVLDLSLGSVTLDEARAQLKD